MADNLFQKAYSGKGSKITNAGKKPENKEELEKIKSEPIESKQEVAVAQEVIVVTPVVETDVASEEQSQPESKIEVAPENPNIIIINTKKERDKKSYKNYYLRNATIEMIDKYSKKTGLNKSELVDMLLEEAFKRMKVK